MSIGCREILDADVEAVVDILTRGFTRQKAYWSRALKTLGDHPTPPGFPKYGYVLDHDSKIVGVLLLISTAIKINGEILTRSNVSSWYVEPDYRVFATLLSIRAMRRKDTTYFNTSPGPHTWPILETHGFERFAKGKSIVISSLARATTGARITMYSPALTKLDIPQTEIDLLEYHQRHGCLSMICDFERRQYPFVFCPQFKFHLIPLLHLIYCRNPNDVVQFQGTIGRFLLRHGFPLLVVDSVGPAPEFFSRFFDGRPRFRKGGDEVRIGDVAYSEQALFGY